jgi:DNA relaxase NicK
VYELLATEMSGFEAGVDYYRASAKHLETPVVDLDTAREWVRNTVEEFGVVTTAPKPQSFLDYKGYQLDSVFAGVRGDGVIFQVSGALARRAWQAVPMIAKATRIDLALTVHFEYDMPFLAMALGKEATRYEFGAGKEPDLTLFHSLREKGDTLTVGSRESAFYGRIYDKYRESGNSENFAYSWRWETELKRELAPHVLSEYRDSLNRPHAVSSIVAGMFADRGVECVGLTIPVRGVGRSLDRDETTYEAKIKHLRRNVAPMIHKLRADGAPDQFLAALLGLDVVEEQLNGDGGPRQ